MHPYHQAYLYVVASSLFYSAASVIFTIYVMRISSVWMNFMKTAVCAVLLALSMVFVPDWKSLSLIVWVALALSGIVTLGIGDLFLFHAFGRMGAARTMVLYGFKPLSMGLASWYFFGQDMSLYRFIAVAFFLLCLFIFSLEKFKEEGHWEIRGLVYALLGVAADNIGILLTRFAFDGGGDLGAVQANFIRCSAAFLFYTAINPFLKARLIPEFLNLPYKERWGILAACTVGTFLPMTLYVVAIRIGHLASIAALGVINPVFSTIIECAVYRKAPSPYLLFALLSFICGFTILMAF